MRAATVLALLALVSMRPAAAYAIDITDVILPFGAHYAASDGGSAVHRGLDVRMAPGEDVDAPCAGEIVFVGRVPSGDGTVLAVSLSSPAGRVTLMPFDRTAVHVGEQVDAGAVLGNVAAAGDPSSSATHLHVGLKTGDLYRDPVVLLSAPPAPATEPEANPEESSAVDPAPSNAPAASPAVAGGVAVSIGADAPSPSTQSVQQMPQPSAPTVVEGTAEIAQGVTLVGKPTRPLPVATTSIEPTALDRLRAAAGKATSEPLGLAVVLVSLIMSTVVLGRRVLERRFTHSESVSHRFGTLLQHVRAGDTLRGLISCSGHDAFTVPGPPAQRR